MNYRQRNNSDLKKLAASSRLDTSLGRSRLDTSVAPKSNKSKKLKRKRTISPFQRLYNNNYKTKKRRRSPAADFSAFSTHSRKSSNLTKRRPSRATNHAKSVSNVSCKSDKYYKSTKCLSINFPSRGPKQRQNSAFFGGCDPKVEQIFVSPPESHMGRSKKVVKKKRKTVTPKPGRRGSMDKWMRLMNGHSTQDRKIRAQRQRMRDEAAMAVKSKSRSKTPKSMKRSKSRSIKKKKFARLSQARKNLK